MSSHTTLARPYARAAFELARSSGELAEWHQRLSLAAAAVQAEPLANLLDHPDLSDDEATRLISEVGGERFDDRFRRFLGTMSKADRLVLLPEVAELYAELREAAEQRMTVRVVSAMALDDDQAERMKLALAERYERAIELETEVDAELIGGAVIYAGGEVIDGSVRGRLERMATRLGA